MKQYPEELEARIAAYIDGELSPAEAARLEVFLANTDPALAEQVIGMIAEKHAVKTLPRERAPEDLAARIMEQVERTTLLSDVEHFSAPRRPWWQGRAAIAAGLLLVVGGFTYFVVQAIVRPDTPWRDAMMEPTHPNSLAKSTAPADVPATSERQVASLDAEGRERERTGEALKREPEPASQLASAAPDGRNFMAPMAAPLSQAESNKESASAAPRPLMLTLIARNTAEYERMRTMLAEWAGQAPSAPAAAITERKAEPQTPSQNQEQLEQAPSMSQMARAADTSPAPAANPHAPSQAVNSNPPAQLTSPNAAAMPNLASSAQQFSLMLRPDQIAMLTHDFQVQRAPAGGLDQSNAPAAPATPTTTPFDGAEYPSGTATQPSAYAPARALAPAIPCIVTIEPPSQPQTNDAATEPAAK